MVDLSIVFPGIRHRNWQALYDSAINAVGDYSFEMIAVGPHHNGNLLKVGEHFKHIISYRAPAPAAQVGVKFAQGKYMTWASDDGIFVPDSLKQCLDLIKTKTRKDAVTVRYREGGNFPGDEYWRAWTHADLRLPGVDKHFNIAPVAMYTTEYFRELGGWDCRFEHLNMCCHDLAFRVQRDGGQYFLSPTEVLDCTWDVHCAEWQPIGRAYRENDRPLWDQMYGVDQSERIKIPYENWQASEEFWSKRFQVL